MKQKRIPFGLKVGLTLFMALLVPIYWKNYDPSNFLWYSDVVLLLAYLAALFELPLLASMAAVGGMFIESFWSLSFLLQLFFNLRFTALTDYMFDPIWPLGLRLLSLFHVGLPPLLFFLIKKLGYDRRGWLLQICVAWVLIFTCWLFTNPEKNINWVYSYQNISSVANSPLFYLFLEAIGFSLLISTSHLLLRVVTGWMEKRRTKRFT